jgi:hypothetical protein
MPLNLLQMHSQAGSFAAEAKGLTERLELLKQRLLAQIKAWDEQTAALRDLVEQKALQDASLRSAFPLDERLTTRHAPPATSKPARALLAADGSQIEPDRHDPIPFGVINVGVFSLHADGRPAPRENVSTRLLGWGEVFTPEGLLRAELLGLMRDVAERRRLLELSANEPEPVVALVDGSLELFHEPRQESEYRRFLTEYLEALDAYGRPGLILAGYVDKPRADLVVRMLRLAMEAEGGGAEPGEPGPGLWPLISDGALFADLLAQGERSAVFGIQSSSRKVYGGEKALHFFYLNVGRPGHAELARVEVPAWVARDPALLDTLQTTLLGQCRLMAARPYPYALHRAHEIAVVRLEEKDELARMIESAWLAQRLPVQEPSYKQAAKDLEGRTRL